VVAFRSGYEEATRLARELPGLGAEDLQGLKRFEVAARIGTGIGASVTTVTGTTQPLPAETGQAARIRELSARRYGQDPQALDEELRSRARGDVKEDQELGRRRRSV
jgi:hypothetical protein